MDLSGRLRPVGGFRFPGDPDGSLDIRHSRRRPAHAYYTLYNRYRWAELAPAGGRCPTGGGSEVSDRGGGEVGGSSTHRDSESASQYCGSKSVNSPGIGPDRGQGIPAPAQSQRLPPTPYIGKQGGSVSGWPPSRPGPPPQSRAATPTDRNN